MILRKYRTSDCEETAKLFYDTVHCINAKDYSEEQLNVWADGNININQWDRRFCGHFTVIAEEDGVIVGFGDIDETGYLDRLYVHKDYQRKGIASAICDRLEKNVLADKILVHASVTAKSFFIKRKYKVVKEQQVERKGVMLTNFVMEKEI